MDNNLPPMPEGFQLDTGGGLPPLPEGFQIEQSPAMDVAKSAGAGVVQGAAGIPGLPGDAQAALRSHNPFDWLASKYEAAYPERAAANRALADKVHRGSDVGEMQLPTTEALKKITGADALDYDPQTTGGKFAKTIGEFVPGAFTGGAGSARQVAANVGRYAVLPGAASEAAGEATEGTKLEPWARTAAAVLAPAAAPRLVSPFANHAPEATRDAFARHVQVLRDEGVPVTAGQASDSQGLKYAENALDPDHAKNMLESFTRAATRRAGAETPVVEHGANGTVDNLLRETGARFDRLQASNTLTADAPLVQDLHRIRQEYTSVPGAYSDKAVHAATEGIDHIGALLVNGRTQMAGEAYQRLRSNLNKAAMGSADPQHSQALHDIVDSLDNAMERSVQRTNPADAGEWGRARGDYKRALVLEKAATAAGESTARGYITPAQLASAAKSVYGKRSYERGHDSFSDLANAGAAVLKALPDSGTAHRNWANHAIGAASGLAGGALGFHLGGGAKEAGESAIAGLLLGEKFEHLFEPATRAAARAALLNPASQRYLGNQAAAGAHRMRDTLPGLLTVGAAARQ